MWLFNSKESESKDEFEKAQVVMTIPVGRSTGKPRIYLFRRRDKEKGDNKLYYATPSGRGAKEALPADKAAGREMEWENIPFMGKVKRVFVMGGVAVYKAEVDDSRTVNSKKAGDWFDLDTLPQPEDFYKNQSEIITGCLDTLKKRG